MANITLIISMYFIHNLVKYLLQEKDFEYSEGTDKFNKLLCLKSKRVNRKIQEMHVLLELEKKLLQKIKCLSLTFIFFYYRSRWLSSTTCRGRFQRKIAIQKIKEKRKPSNKQSYYLSPTIFVNCSNKHICQPSLQTLEEPSLQTLEEPSLQTLEEPLEEPVGIYMFKVNNRNTRTRCEICSKLTIKTPFHTLF